MVVYLSHFWAKILFLIVSDEQARNSENTLFVSCTLIAQLPFVKGIYNANYCIQCVPLFCESRLVFSFQDVSQGCKLGVIEGT